MADVLIVQAEILDTMDNLELFLRESNKIEGVFDDESFNEALEAWNFINSNYELDLKVLLETHRILMQNKLWYGQAGFLRKGNVRIGEHVFPDWQSMPNRVNNWIFQNNNLMKFPRSTENNEAMAKHLHIKFEKIHPFVDGNGRIGRILMNWWRTMVGLPILIIYAKDREDYYRWFL